MPCNLYDVELGSERCIGPVEEIQKGLKVGEKSRMQRHTFVCELVIIGESCFIRHGVMFIIDLFENGGPGRDSALWRETKSGNNVSIGSNATILPVSIWDGVVIGAGGVVTKDITKKGIYAGNPARLIREINDRYDC